MGLDIHIQTDNDDQIFTPDYHDPQKDYFNKHSLSRTFCNFMCRKDVISDVPELDQIGHITKVDITPLYIMERYWDEENIESQLTFAVTEEEKEHILQRIADDRRSIENNIDKVYRTITDLIDALSKIDNLPSQLTDNGWDSLENKNYFADFNIDKGQGYIGNNFGQDLRNFKRFLEYAKQHNAKTVYFSYG